jgi:hypothetical protein
MPKGKPANICGRKKAGGTKCLRSCGWGIPGVTIGPCKFHKGRPIIHGLYSKLTHNPRLKEALARVQARERDILDLSEEIDLMRAMILHYVEFHEEKEEELTAWFQSYNRTLVIRVEQLRHAMSAGEGKKLRMALQNVWESLNNEPAKPGNIPDISRCAALVDTLGRLVEKAHRIRAEGFVPLATVMQLKTAMAHVVALEVKDDAILQRIESQWMRVQLVGVKQVA